MEDYLSFKYAMDLVVASNAEWLQSIGLLHYAQLQWLEWQDNLVG